MTEEECVEDEKNDTLSIESINSLERHVEDIEDSDLDEEEEKQLNEKMEKFYRQKHNLKRWENIWTFGNIYTRQFISYQAVSMNKKTYNINQLIINYSSFHSWISVKSAKCRVITNTFEWNFKLKRLLHFIYEHFGAFVTE